MSRNHWMMLLAAAPLLPGAAACSDDGTTPNVDGYTLFLSVAPEGGATDVDPDGPIEVRFDHPMMAGMEGYAILHLGDVRGPAVAGTWSLSPDRTALTLTPDSRLQRGTRYAIHLGGGMMDADGHPVDWGTHGPRMGGERATGKMMGSGWTHATGSYGMVFTFTIAE